MLPSLPLFVATAVLTVAAAQHGPAIGGANPILEHARTHERRSGGDGPKVLTYKLKEQEVNSTTFRRRFRRKRQSMGGEPPDRTVSDYHWVWKDVEDFRGLAYFIELEIGDPIQSVLLMPDTGSYETWVNPNCAEGRASDPYMCVRNGQYDISRSQLGYYLGDRFTFQYGTGAATGKYAQDRFYFRHENVAMIQKFGVATDSVYAVAGIMGLGYGNNYSIKYNNVLDTLVAINYIQGPIFTTALGRIGEGLSEIVFGGVNRSRYSGKLTPITVWPGVYSQPNDWVHYKANVTSFSVSLENGTSATFFWARNKAEQVNVLIDTGVTNTYMPWPVVDAFASFMGAIYDEIYGELQVDCKWRSNAGTVNFGFNDNQVEFHVPLSDFVFPLGDGRCVLGMQKRGDPNDDSILGQPFLRGVYVAWDQMTHHLWMADYKRCGMASEVKEVGRELYDVANVIGLC